MQPGGLRFATCGNDCNVKIWSLPAALDARQENAANPKLLATLSDHTSPVDVVRFSPSGTQLASGSDDAVVCIYDLRPGAGAGVLGGESNVENWRTRHTLRGHATHVVDLCWSPDGSRLATASLDRTVAIWDTTKGAKIATIDAHGSFVKGVAWDPVGTYLATQSEDKSVAIWRTDDWSLVGRVTSPFKQMITSTFSCRLAWSPDGCFLLAGNSYQGATHAAVLVPREKWQNVDEYLYISGHAGAVTATAFSPKLRHLPPLGGGKPEGDNLSAVFAVGGQDRRITVWAAGRPRPILILSKLFGNSVQDVRWTPDGRTLLAASLEGEIRDCVSNGWLGCISTFALCSIIVSYFCASFKLPVDDDLLSHLFMSFL